MKEIEDDTDGMIYCVHGMEELILLKHPYYPRQSKIQFLSLSKYSKFHRTGTNNPKIDLVPQRPQIAKALLRKKNRARDIMLPNFILQSYSNQKRIVLAQKQTQRSIEQNRDSRNKPMHL